MSYTLDFPIQYIANPDRFATIGLGKLYIGVVDGDPAFEVADRIQAYIARQNDTDLPIPQPIELSAGGVPTYLGSPVTLKINQSFSCAVLDSSNQQIYYSPKTGEIIDEITDLTEQVADLAESANSAAENVPALALFSPVAGRVYYLKEYNIGTKKGGGQLLAISGAISPDNVETFSSANPAIYFKRINYDHLTSDMAGFTGAANESARLQALFDAAASGNKKAEILDGTIYAKNVSIPNGLTVFGKGTVKRIANDTEASFVLRAIGVSGFDISGITLDGNKAENASFAGHTLYINQCWNYKVHNCKAINARAISGFGDGLVISDNKDADNGTISVIYKVDALNNESNGISPFKATGLWIDGVRCAGNGLAGCSLVDFTDPPPSAPSSSNVRITSSIFNFNGGSGLEIGGYIEAYAGGLPVSGGGKNPLNRVIVDGCYMQNNSKYGYVCQSSNVKTSKCFITNNGDDFTNGGVLFNALNSDLIDCTISDNYFYGVDAGGAVSCTFTGGRISNNGQVGSSSSGINISAGRNNKIHGVYFSTLPTANGGYCVSVNAFDGGVDPVFPTLANRNEIKDCTFFLNNNDVFGVIGDTGDMKNTIVNDNEFFGGLQGRAVVCSANQFIRVNNRHWIGDNTGFSVSSATSVVIPDQEEDILITGAASVQNIYTTSINENLQKVRTCAVTNGGSGYAPGTSTPVTFSGGGGTGAAGYGLVSNAGILRAVVITNKGSGYTSAPTVTIGGTGVGAAAVALINCNNIEKNRITVKFDSTATLVNATGNLRLIGGNIVGTPFLYVTLEGRNGLWYEVSRSG